VVGVAARTAVVAGTATAVSGRVARRQQRRYAEEDQAYVQQVTEPLAPEAPAEPDYAAELEKLAQLKNQGILSEEEFEAKKKQILGI
jgi:predicted Zn-dependent peptidase